MFELEEVRGQNANIKVVGVGGAGGNIVNNMISTTIRAVEFIAVNTDAQALENSLAGRRVQIGGGLTRGLGAGAKLDIGRDAAFEDKAAIAECLEGADLVFVAAGMGGGTGSGASPVVAEIARSLGALTVAVVTKPFFYEGGQRRLNAEEGIKELSKNVDTIITIPNDRISMVVERGTPLLQSFAVANDILRHAVQGIADLILVSGLINLDFADVKAVMENAGRSVMGMGTGRGENRAREAATRAVSNPLLESSSIDGAKGVLINITGGLELSLSDVEEAASLVYEASHEDANIILGAVINPDMNDEIRVTIIATGFEHEPVKRMPEVPFRQVAVGRLKASERVLSKSLKEEPQAPAVPYGLDAANAPFLRKPIPKAI